MNNFLDMIKSYNTTTRKVAAFTLNQMQANLDCCGINSYSDWNTLTCVKITQNHVSYYITLCLLEKLRFFSDFFAVSKKLIAYSKTSKY